jgi:chromosome segregation ATPase
MESLANLHIPTDAYKQVNTELEKANTALKKLYDKQDKMTATGVEKTSREWRNLQSDITKTTDKISSIRAAMESLANQQLPREEYKYTCDQIEKIELALEKMYNKQDQMNATGVKKTSQAWRNLQYAINNAEEQLNRWETSKARMENEGRDTQLGIETEQYKQMRVELEKAESELLKLRDKETQMNTSGVEKTSQAWRNLQYDIKNAEEAVARFERQKAQLENSGRATQLGSETEQYKQMEQELNRVSQGTENMTQKVNGATSGTQQYVSAMSDEAREMQESVNPAQAAANEYMEAAQAGYYRAAMLVQALKTALKGMGKAAVSAFKNLIKYTAKAIVKLATLKGHTNSTESAIKKLTKVFTGFGAKIKGILKRRLTSNLISGVQEGFQNLAQVSDETNKSISSVISSLSQLKNSFATAFAPILNIVAPILSTFIDLLSEAFTRIGMFTAALTGATTFIKFDSRRH